MILEGLIENIVYRNDDNGYTVASLSHGMELDTIVGKALTIHEGESVKLEGDFVVNSKYGRQFSFANIELVEPKTEEAIEKYLASGLIYGVGEVTAKLIVEKFKKDALDVIEFTPEKLSQIRGISKKRADQISEGFQEVKKLQRVVMFLQKYEITTNMSMKIFNVYGEKTIDTVKQNPYKLVEDVDGIGFLTADRLAKKMGIDPESEFRVRAGVLHILKESSEKSGNTYLPKYLIFDGLIKLLLIEKEKIEKKFDAVLENLVLDKFLTIFFEDKIESVMLSKFYQTENSIAKKLSGLCCSSMIKKRNVESEIDNFEKRNNIQFHSDQKKAITVSISSAVSVITGGPGTGKTTIVKAIIEILKQSGEKVLLVAPTGRAAKRLSETTGEEAKTIHRALELQFSGKSVSFKYGDKSPLEYNAIIVDEVSMVDAMLMNSLTKALPRDSRLILVGDKDQLPSVGAGNVLEDILKSEEIPVTYLTKIYRQEETSLIVSNAHRINNGEMPVFDNASKDFFFEQISDMEKERDEILALVTNRIPQYLNIDETKIQVLGPLKAGICGVENLNRALQERINPSSVKKSEQVVGSTTFRVGDKVMQTTNNYDLSWVKQNGNRREEGIGVFNGDIGFIHSIDYQTGETKIWFEDGREALYTRPELVDLSLAYAITIHKSQGCEFDVVVLPLISGASIILTRNLFYTAVTRAKKMVVLVGEKRNIQRMVANTYQAKRYTMLAKFLKKEMKKAREIYG